MTRRIRVRLSHQHPLFPLLRQTPGASGAWGAYEFLQDLDDDEPVDYWVVCEGVLGPQSAQCAPANVLLVTWEPPGGIRPPYKRRFLRQFGSVVTCDPHLRHASLVLQQQAQPWFVGRSYDELAPMTPPDKPRLLSIVTSDKAWTAGHRFRLAVAHGLQDHFGDEADLLGRGFAPFPDKWDALAPYRYSLAVENTVAADYVTEKLADCFLAFSHPLYVGAPNADDYYPTGSFTALPAGDVDAAVGAAVAVVGRVGHWESSLPALVEARRRYLDEQQLFPMLARLLSEHAQRHGDPPRERVRIKPEFPPHDLVHRARARLAERRRGRR